MRRSESVGSVETRFHTLSEPFVTQGGVTIPEVTLAYEIYGEIDDWGGNVVLVFHALSGSQHAAGFNPSVPGVGDRWVEENHQGWWDPFIGPGCGLDTDRLAVICVNYLGGCYGSTGPSSVNPETGREYGSVFPKITLTDVVDAQVKLLDELGIRKLKAVVGASLGGQMAAVLAVKYPERVDTIIPIASGFHTTPLQVLHNFEQMFAIVTDPDFEGGDYYPGAGPRLGLTLARMIGHKTFVSLEAIRERARDEIVSFEDIGGYRVSSPLESYMLHLGRKFVNRFDANSYMRIMEMWQQFDLVNEVGGPEAKLSDLLSRCQHQLWQVFTIDSDVCFYPSEQARMVKALKAAGVNARRFTVHSEKGHDSFLIEPELYSALLRDVLETEW